MKKVLLALMLIIPFCISAQMTTPHTVTFDGESRYYIKHVPTGYDGSTPIPLLFSLHGLGDDADNFSGIGFHQLANVENFIVITPEALVDPLAGSTAWNSGAGVMVGPLTIVLNENVKDKEWIGSLIDDMVATYNIDENRIYSTGFSMGSFMSQRLACELNDRIAAIASVAGAIGNGVDCVPGRSFPMCHFHGTADGTVGYTDNTYGTDAQETVDFWATNNGCNASPTSTELPDTYPDGFTVTHHVYNGCSKDVEFYSVANAPHTWLQGNNDIAYTPKIWEFLSRQSLTGGATNSAPVAQDDMATTPQNTAVEIDVLDNDNDPDGSLVASSVEVTDGPDNGMTSVNNSTGVITYTPDMGYFGPDLIEYTVCDNGSPALCTTAEVDITVSQVSAVLEDMLSGFEIYPNPMRNNGLISFRLDRSTELEIRLIDVAGSEVYRQVYHLDPGANVLDLNIADYARGAYVLMFSLDGNNAGTPLMLY